MKGTVFSVVVHIPGIGAGPVSVAGCEVRSTSVPATTPRAHDVGFWCPKISFKFENFTTSLLSSSVSSLWQLRSFTHAASATAWLAKKEPKLPQLRSTRSLDQPVRPALS